MRSALKTLCCLLFFGLYGTITAPHARATDDALEFIYSQLSSSDIHIANAAFDALAKLKPSSPRNDKILGELLVSATPEIVDRAAQAIFKFAHDPQRFDPALRAAIRLSDESRPEIRQRAAALLGLGIKTILRRQAYAPFPQHAFVILTSLAQQGAGTDPATQDMSRPNDRLALPHDERVGRLAKENVRIQALKSLAEISQFLWRTRSAPVISTPLFTSGAKFERTLSADEVLVKSSETEVDSRVLEEIQRLLSTIQKSLAEDDACKGVFSSKSGDLN